MVVRSITDLHLNPGEMFPQELAALDGLLVLNEVFNILPLGMDVWRTSPRRYTVDSVKRGLPKSSHFVLANHDGRLSWLKELVGSFAPVTRELELVAVDGAKWRFVHGHKFTYWRVLSWGADDVVEWLTSNKLTQRLWYKFAIKQGWMPGRFANPGTDYERFVGWYWGLILEKAHRDHVNYVVGHSHTQNVMGPSQFNVTVIDCGAGQLTEVPMEYEG